MKKYQMIGDILFYLALPYFIWKFGQEPLGNYYAMLLSTTPGIVYTIFRFFADKQFNVTGVFILASMSVTTIIDLLSQSAERMQWNNVYTAFGFGLFWIITMIMKKPFALYLMADISALQGIDREKSKKLYRSKKLLPLFYMVSILFAARSMISGFLRAYLINTIGISHYDKILFYMKVYGWIFGAIMAVAFVYVGMKISNEMEKENPEPKIEGNENSSPV
ncbi:hypothetical protein LRR81_18670 [Metabacillus sp. GX 13764]|uniref:VC0807 family protein n=1 Tax=Metabacillus kandeliae TaxID=2900151 RepID=UPI001E286799|nr:VC0807 family protein [Metabacillus kandeliae]MCD7036272.1 hypothetical protein [Metabacillus kandeliae]